MKSFGYTNHIPSQYVAGGSHVEAQTSSAAPAAEGFAGSRAPSLCLRKAGSLVSVGEEEERLFHSSPQWYPRDPARCCENAIRSPRSHFVPMKCARGGGAVLFLDASCFISIVCPCVASTLLIT